MEVFLVLLLSLIFAALWYAGDQQPMPPRLRVEHKRTNDIFDSCATLDLTGLDEIPEPAPKPGRKVQARFDPDLVAALQSLGYPTRKAESLASQIGLGVPIADAIAQLHKKP